MLCGLFFPAPIAPSFNTASAFAKSTRLKSFLHVVKDLEIFMLILFERLLT